MLRGSPSYDYALLPREEKVEFRKKLVAFIFIFAVFILESTFRIRGYDEKSVDFQVLLKLASWCLLLFVPFLARGGARHKVKWTYSSLFLGILLLWLAVSCLISPNPAYSFVAIFSLLSFFVGIRWIISRYGEEFVALCVVHAVTLICIGSFIVYFLNPEVGRTYVWISGRLTETNRMAGIAGAATVLGNITSVAILFVVLYFDSISRMIGRRQLFLRLALFCVTLFMSQSRGSAVTMLVCLFIFFFARKKTSGILAAAAVYMLLALVVIGINFDDVIPLLTRSGDAQEILTATNRTAIWSVVVSLISERPFAGWGYASSIFILPNLEFEIGEAAPHTHNLVLQLMFSGGIVALFAFVICISATVLNILRSRNRRAAIFLLYLIILGATQAGPFQGLANFSFIVFAFVICISHLPKISHAEPEASAGSSGAG